MVWSTFRTRTGGSDTVGPGQAALFEADTPHRHDSVGTVPRSNVGFEMTCEPQPNSIGNTGNLPVRSGAVAHEIQVRERIWHPGARTPVHVLSGPTATLVLEGTIQTTSTAGATCFGPGEIYVSPVDVVAQNINVGNVPARTLDVDLWPTGEIRSVPQPEDRLVPSAISPSCPLK
jgi:quercetin dioxygenase-like cupin family protein